MILMKVVRTIFVFLVQLRCLCVASKSYEVQMLEAQARNQNRDDPATQKLWVKILELYPKSREARLELGLSGIVMPDPNLQRRAIEMLEEMYDRTVVDEVIEMPSGPAIVIASVIGRWRLQYQEYERSQIFLQIALDNVRNMGMNDKFCLSIQLGSMLNEYPKSIKGKEDSMKKYLTSMKSLVSNRIEMEEKVLVQSVPGAAADPYVHCLCSLFNLEFYVLEEKNAEVASLHFQLAKKIWPALAQKLPTNRGRNSCSSSNSKIKLGIASGLFNKGTPVESDFKGILRKLNRDKFDITFIIGKENSGGHSVDVSPVIFENIKDKLMFIEKLESDNSATFVTRYHQQIWDLELDIMLFLDTTMSTFIHRLAMTKLAPVQAVSHGHPVTSGFPREIMDYYISWGAAELPNAQSYYTEKLLLLPSDSVHQYYDYSIEKHHLLPFIQQGREALFEIPGDGNWYLCMQKPMKFQPEFDEILCGILNADPNGRLILHEPYPASNYDIIVSRLRAANCDMFRVHFLPAQPHIRLLALYSLSEVVLDSYPFGGCTTTRETFELGKILVTYPSFTLGSRWSLAYYNIMGDEILNDHVIATSSSDYVEKAAKIGSNKEFRKDLEARLRKSFPKLLHSTRAVLQWEDLLTSIAPQSTCSK